MLCTIGDLIEDVVVWQGEPTHHASDTPSRIERTRGGSAANVAYFAAASGLPARFIGQVGDDRLGDQLIESMRAAGADVIAPRGGRTGCVVVLVQHDGERTMFPDRGCSPDLANLDPSVLDGVTALHVPMYSLTTGQLADTASRLIAQAHERGILVSIDASSVSVLEDFGITESLALIGRLKPSVLLCNDDEARALGLDSLPNGVSTLVVKRGPRPVQVYDQTGTREFEVGHVDHVVDTTGAGDAFAAGFLTSLATTNDLTKAVAAGHALAVRALSSPGATLGAMEQR
ncbi:MAG: carbohydrate kinase family protein [Ilumatobacteraceae bacterium]